MRTFDKASGHWAYGFVFAVGPKNNLNYFTSSGYSVHRDDAKVFRTAKGARLAARHWEKCEWNFNKRLPDSWFKNAEILPVFLSLEPVDDAHP